MTARRRTPAAAAALAVALAAALAALAGSSGAASPAQPATTTAAAPGATASGPPWWIKAIRADRVTPPGPGVAVAFVDTGVDMGLPLFDGRPNTFPLNGQRLHNVHQFHGSAVASLVVGNAATEGGDLWGVYPRAKLVIWNATDRGELTLKQIVDGIDAVSSRGPVVINMSVGGGFYSPDLQHAILRAIARGCFIVASTGNERPLVTFLARPAGEPHVFTVSAVGPTLGVSNFSSQSSGIDVAAPGENLRVAVPHSLDDSGESSQSGTSFSAAIVSGVAAWVWTRRPDLDAGQLFEVLRRSARHVGRAGVNIDTGWGVIDVQAALRYPAPPKDPQEPNDDIDQVAPGPVIAKGRPFLVGPSTRHATVRARIDGRKDPHDLYRVLIPAGATLTVRSNSPTGTRVRFWDVTTKSVDGITSDQPRHLLSTTKQNGGKVDLRYTNTGSQAIVAYVDMWMIGDLASQYALDATLTGP